MHWNYFVLIVCLIVATFAIIKEYRRNNKQRLGLRMAASLAGVAALGAIGLPVYYQGERTNGINDAVLLTKGYDRDSLVKFNGDTIYTTDAAVKKTYPNAKLATASQLKRVSPAIRRLHILGYGLNRHELKDLDAVPVVFHPSHYPGGIVSANWPQKLKQGQQFVVQGHYNNTANGHVNLILKELNTTVDSVIINRQGTIDFELKSRPKGAGRIINRLIALSGDDTLENERLPFIIQPVNPLKILVLEASPGFENKFLKDWLTEQGFGVAVRTVISKDKLSTQFINLPQLSLTYITATVLDKFDEVIADLSVLKSLSGAESAQLKQQVSQNGLGMIIMADTMFKAAAPMQNDFTLYQENSKDQRALFLQFQGMQPSPSMKTSARLFIKQKDGMQTLVSDSKKRVVAGAAINGTGKIICTTVNETHTWMLAGDKQNYDAYWSLLIGKAAKTASLSADLAMVFPFPSIDDQVTLQVQTGGQPGQMLIDVIKTSPEQNETLPFEWQSTFWPSQAGWHSINYSGGPPHWFYIYNKTDWSAIKAVNNILDNKKFASAAAVADVTKQIHQKVKIPVPKIYFYILLLLCCAFLWAESKFNLN